MSVLTKSRFAPVIRRFLNRVDHRTAVVCKPQRRSKAPPPVKQLSMDWVSYGFDYEDPTEDYNNHHASFFFTVTLCIIFGGFAWVYAPDICLRDWAQREAFLELRRRETAGLPPIDPNYIPAKKMKLPAQKELTNLDFDILI